MPKKKPYTQRKPQNKTSQSPIEHSHKAIFKSFFEQVKKDKLLLKLFYILSFIASIVLPRYLNADKPYIFTSASILILVIVRITFHYMREYQFRVKPIILICICSLIFIGAICSGVYKLTYKPSEPDPCENAHTIMDYFNCDNPMFLPFDSTEFIFTPADDTTKFVFFHVYIVPDLDNTKYDLACAVLIREPTFTLKVLLTDFLPFIDSIVKKLRTGITWAKVITPTREIDIKTFRFSNDIYFYFDTMTPTNDKENLINLYRTHNYNLTLRGKEYVIQRKMKKKLNN